MLFDYLNNVLGVLIITRSLFSVVFLFKQCAGSVNHYHAIILCRLLI